MFQSKIFTGIICLLFLFSCKNEEDYLPRALTNDPDTNVVTQWVDMTLSVIHAAERSTPTYSSRSLGYLGLTMYETVVHSSKEKKSLVSKLNGLEALPLPDRNLDYQWELALNAGQAFILKQLYGYTDSINTKRINKLYSDIEQRYNGKISGEVKERSIQLGLDIAMAIYEWSKSDGGHEGYNFLFDDSYVMPEGDSVWVAPVWNSQSASKIPLHPHWGENRNFASANSLINNPFMPIATPYSNSDTSLCYKQFYELYQKSKNLTQEEKEIAVWWADDPSFTYSPAGHSYNIAKIIVKDQKPDLVKSAETFARVGMATADAFINCWRCKYVYFRERPSGYINRNIDPNWFSWWPEPPFPSFASGHATQGMAAATALVSLYGNNISFTDDTNIDRAKDFYRNVEFKKRRYYSILAFAEECGKSRFYGGIHIQYDNDKGAEDGAHIAENINRLFE